MAEAKEPKPINIENFSDLTEDIESDFDENEEFTGDKTFSVRRDIEFCELYFKVIDKQLSRGDYKENIKQALHYFSKIRSETDMWCRFKEINDLEQINLLKQSFYYRMFCIYSNATCVSSAVASNFENFLNQNSKYLKNLINKNTLKICSVGSGLPSDIVAIIKVLKSSIYIKDDVKIHITVVDVDKKWKKPCLAILHSMEDFNKEKWQVDFVILDPSSQSVSPKVANAIKEADIVSVLKFLTQMENQDAEIKRILFLKLSLLVSPGSVLFLMDDSVNESIQVFQGYLGRLRGHNLLFEVACRLHTLQLPVVKRHYDLYSKHLISSGMFNTSFELFCRAWVRTQELFFHTGSCLESFDPQIKMAEKSLEIKKSWHGQMRLLCRQLGNGKVPDDWKDCFVTEMQNQRCSKKRIQRTLSAAEKDLDKMKLYAKQLMFASYQDFLEDARELRDARKESDEALKEKKRKDFYRLKRKADFERQTYESSIQRLLQCLGKNQSTKTKLQKA